MISQNDTTILAALSRYPDMPSDEADENIARIDHPDNIALAQAILGRISRADLSPESQQNYDQFWRWSQLRTRRTREQEWSARRQRQNTRLSLALTRLYEQGIISQQLLVLYGVSGELPSPEAYQEMTHDEREAYWAERMENRFGPGWRERFDVTNMVHKRLPIQRPCWRLEGF